jgi:uncharacterized repeat protein (TIGR03803 family)
MRKLRVSTVVYALLLSSCSSNGNPTLPLHESAGSSPLVRKQSVREIVLAKFTSPGYRAEDPSPLTPDGAGNYYGTTLAGGSGYGTVYELSPAGHGGWKQTTLYSFSGFDDGRFPAFTPLVLAKNGGRLHLYGETGEGGQNNTGVAFELRHERSGWKETVLYNFGVAGSVGEYPFDALIRDSSGNLYGCVDDIESEHFVQAIFELSPPRPADSNAGWTGQIIYNAGVVSASNGNCGLVMSSSGKIFGFTSGLFEPATVFELSHSGSSWTPTVLYTFRSLKSYPIGAPVLDKAGNIYGTTFGGENKTKNGTVYELSPSQTEQWTEKILYAFKGGKDGSGPYAGITFDASGNIYGTTMFGGPSNKGTAFELAARGARYNEELLWSFNGKDGANPGAPVVVDSSGNVFSTTTAGGGDQECYAKAGCGNAFEIMRNN